MRLAVFLGVLVGMMGCRATIPPAASDVESVGNLSASATHVYTAPVHATTDFGHAEIVDTGDDDRTATVTTTTPAPDAGGADAAELPDISPKDQGLKTGAVRQ